MDRAVSLSSLKRSLDSNETVAVVSSRLGHSLPIHRHVCRFLCRSLLDSRARGATLMVATGSAIEPWAVRAAEIFGVPLVRIAVDKDAADADFFVSTNRSPALSRDQLIIQLADRVDAVYVRRGGAIAKCIAARIQRRQDASTRVAITRDAKCAATGLIAGGAIGWYFPGPASVIPTDNRIDFSSLASAPDDAWIRTEGQWLIHCTRAPRGRWPEETPNQYRDSLILGDERCRHRESIDSLMRIVRSGRLMAGSTATKTDYPVVCFSEVSLAQLLDRRCFRPQLGRWDYEPFGVAIRLSTAKSLGIQPVVYGEPKMRATLPGRDQFRFHPVGRTFDWRVEKEWRSNGSIDLNQLGREDVRVFAANSLTSRNGLADCPWAVSFIPSTADLRV